MTRNKSQLFKETAWVITLTSHRSACNCNNMQISVSVLYQHTAPDLVPYMGSFLSVTPVDQKQRQLAVRFYCRWCIMRSGVSVLASKIRLVMTVVI